MSSLELLKKEQEIMLKEYEMKLEQIKEAYEDVGWGDLEWLSEKTTIKSRDGLQEKILFPFRQELEGKIIRYGAKGKPYIINKKLMIDWLENNFERVWE